MQESYDFDLDDSVFTGDSEFALNQFGVGVRFIFSPRVALSLSNINKEVLGIKTATMSGELFSEEINFLKVEYNQVLLQFRAFNFGFNLYYDADASGDDIDSRTAYGGRIYSVIGRSAHRLRIYAGGDSIDKETEIIEIHQNNTYGGLEYIYRFK
jgi:hypothetical protein